MASDTYIVRSWHGDAVVRARYVYFYFMKEEPERIRQLAARGRLERWTIPVQEYGEFNGVRIATEGDGMWNYASGDFTYIHRRITAVDYSQPSRYR